ncbi:MAG: formylglycine-generating enzyme family protein [Magnetococcus sp. XQGC-1]
MGLSDEGWVASDKSACEHKCMEASSACASAVREQQDRTNQERQRANEERAREEENRRLENSRNLAISGIKAAANSTGSVSVKTIKNSIGMEFVQIPSGSFMMGSDKNFDSKAGDSETPRHRVTISTFCLGKYEVTQDQWVSVMGSNPSKFKGRTLPVEQVSWDDAQGFT